MKEQFFMYHPEQAPEGKLHSCDSDERAGVEGILVDAGWVDSPAKFQDDDTVQDDAVSQDDQEPVDAVDEPTPQVASMAENALADKSKDELKAIADEMGIAYTTRTTVDELTKLITEAQ